MCEPASREVGQTVVSVAADAAGALPSHRGGGARSTQIGQLCGASPLLFLIKYLEIKSLIVFCASY